MKPKKSSLPDDELTMRLRAAARKKRPWTWLGLVITFVIVAVPLGLFAWWVWPRPVPPPLIVLTFDALGLPGEELVLRARLEPKEEDAAGAILEGWDIVFEEVPPRPGGPARSEKTTSDANGEATVSWSFRGKEPVADYIVRYLGDRKRKGGEDRGRVYLRAVDTALVLVDVDSALATASEDQWRKKKIGEIAPLAGAGDALRAARDKGSQVVYLALTPERAWLYRKMRSWVESKVAGQDAFPAGPVLGRSSYDQDAAAARHSLLGAIKTSFRGPLRVVTSADEMVAAAQAQGIKTILLGKEAVPAGVTAAKSWADAAKHLGK